MRIAEVIGKVTLSQWHDSLRGATWLVGVPLDQAGLKQIDHAGLKRQNGGRGEAFVIYDELGANGGSLIAVSEGAEASAPFHPNQKPIDAYNAAILDSIDVD